MYTLVDGVEFYDKDEVDDIVRAITGGSLPNEDGIRNELTTKIEAEATEREQADIRLSTELGTRIDEEVAAREAATAANKSLIDTETQARAAVDTLLSNQLAALEQLHTTLIGPNGFVDSDGDTVKANDSGKSIRQIAHEEFYRQLITDADNVKTQLDTLKELADYLQQNPSIITDMYSKLGITWSIDNPTDFGTFDFSRVLTATNVDDAVLELYNTFTNKIGDLTQLTTTRKDSIVGAVNELDTDIGNEVTARTDADAALGTRIDGEVTARTDADTALGTRIDGEVTAREQADTALGTRIDTEVGTLSALTTTAKDSIVGAVNELDTDIGNEVTARTDADAALGTRIDNEVTAREQADTQLGTRIDGEVTAREQADTALGTRIDTEVGTLSALTTTAKDSIVGAVNELDTDIGNEVTAREQADTALGTRIDTEVGTLSALTTTAKDNVVAAINEVNGKVGTGGGGGGDGAGVAQLETKLNEEITTRGQADTALGTRIDTEVGTLSALTTTAKDSVVAAINEVNGKVGTGGGGGSNPATNCEQFSFVVDSNDKLTQWVNNDKSSGQDYTSVLIRKGEWTSTTGVNLTTAGTKVVVGEPGSKLVFNAVEKGLYYDTAPTESEYYMRDVTVTVVTGESYGYAFTSCTNLTNCTGTSTGTATGYGFGFHSCTNLINCTGTGADHGYGFHSCTNLTNCTGTGTSTSKGSGIGYGFRSCTNLTNCTGTVYGYGYGFHSCTKLTNCTGSVSASASASGSGYGFRSCTNLTNCTGTGTGTGTGSGADNGYGFRLCTNLTNCTGTGTGSGSGYGFLACTVVIGCKAGGHCTTGVFQDCYASSSKTSAYACADTPNGGFNNTTNPAA